MPNGIFSQGCRQCLLQTSSCNYKTVMYSKPDIAEANEKKNSARGGGEVIAQQNTIQKIVW